MLPLVSLIGRECGYLMSDSVPRVASGGAGTGPVVGSVERQ